MFIALSEEVEALELPLVVAVVGQLSRVTAVLGSWAKGFLICFCYLSVLFHLFVPHTHLSFCLQRLWKCCPAPAHAVVPSPLVEGCRLLPGRHVHKHAPHNLEFSPFLTDLV